MINHPSNNAPSSSEVTDGPVILAGGATHQTRTPPLEGDGWVNWSGLATALGELSPEVAERVIRLSGRPGGTFGGHEALSRL